MWFKDVIMLNWDFIWKQTIGIFVSETYTYASLDFNPFNQLLCQLKFGEIFEIL